MNLVLEVSQAEFDTCQKLESLGWVRPAGITVALQGPAVADAKVGTIAAGAVVGAAAAVKSAAVGGFDVVFDWLIPEEGGYTDDPNDPGGATKYGIDTKDDKAEWSAMGVADLHNLTLDQAKAIYQKKYWIGALCNTMPTPVAETHFNYAVNVGQEQSVKFLQTALGVNVDGQYGAITQAALKAEDGAGMLKGVALGMVQAADSFYHGLAQQERFAGDLKGWLNRNNSLRELIGKLA